MVLINKKIIVIHIKGCSYPAKFERFFFVSIENYPSSLMYYGKNNFIIITCTRSIFPVLDCSRQDKQQHANTRNDC